MDVKKIDSFFTPESIVTFQGATLATWLITNGVGYLLGSRFDWVRKWIAIIVAFAIEYYIASLAPNAGAEKWFVAFFNAFVIFASAIGINQMTSRPSGAGGAGTPAGRTFSTRWIR